MGTLRENVDPFSEWSDATLNDALAGAGLFALQSKKEEGNRLNLDSPIASGGSNLSVGQRQIIALARAILRRSQLLILDEGERCAVTNDPPTDSIPTATSAIGKRTKLDNARANMRGRLRDGLDHPRVTAEEGGQRRNFAYRRTSSADHYGLRQDCEPPLAY